MSNSPSPQSLNTDPAHISYILDQAIDLMPIGIWLLDAGGSIIYGNETARKIWGEIRFLHESEFDQFEAWTVPGNVPIQKNEWAAHQALQGELTLNQEIKIKGFDGVFRYVRNSAIPIRNANGEITHCVAINQEITDLRLSEDRLAATVAQLSDKVQEAEMLTLAVNQAAEHFVITDPDGVIIFANESVEEVTGYSKDEVMGSKAGKLWS